MRSWPVLILLLLEPLLRQLLPIQIKHIQYSLNPSLAGTTSPTIMINDKIQAAIGLNPSLAGTTSPTVDSCWWEHQLLSLNPSLAGTTSPTGDFFDLRNGEVSS